MIETSYLVEILVAVYPSVILWLSTYGECNFQLVLRTMCNIVKLYTLFQG